MISYKIEIKNLSELQSHFRNGLAPVFRLFR